MTYLLAHQADSWGFQASLKHMPQVAVPAGSSLSALLFNWHFVPAPAAQPEAPLLAQPSSKLCKNFKKKKKFKKALRTLDKMIAGLRRMALVSAADIICAAGAAAFCQLPKIRAQEHGEVTARLWSWASWALLQSTKGREFTFKSHKVIFTCVLSPLSYSLVKSGLCKWK